MTNQQAAKIKRLVSRIEDARTTPRTMWVIIDGVLWTRPFTALNGHGKWQTRDMIDCPKVVHNGDMVLATASK